METHERGIRGEALQGATQTYGREVRWLGMHVWRLSERMPFVVQ
jgi:hypothetical protein